LLKAGISNSAMSSPRIVVCFIIEAVHIILLSSSLQMAF
jgi:hypothetical protein